jgi:lysophospholipase L1-like esterase
LRRSIPFSFLLLVSLVIPASAAPPAPHWVGSWASSQQPSDPQNAAGADDLNDTTLRQIIHLSIGGSSLRVHLSNAFGTAPLHITAVHIARPLSTSVPTIDPATDKPLTFAGNADLLIPAGAEYISDPVSFHAAALSDLAITLHLESAPAHRTGHPGSRATSWSLHGDHVADPAFADAKHADRWLHIAAVDVAAQPRAAAIVTLGDSITDGHGATTNANDRWPDILALHLQSSPSTRSLGVLNQGIGGNRILLDGLGPNALARFERDVLSQTGVRFLLILEGVNDLGTLTRTADVSAAEHAALVRRLLSAYNQIILRAHAHGIRVIGATILPYAGSEYYHPGPALEADRSEINQWIRTPGHFDGFVDFDKLMGDPARPAFLAPAFDSGDHLHPSAAGYRAMGNAIPLTLFTH